MEKTPLVSVCCITYNHAPYISQCVDGFLMQKTSFPYEIIINDDCSSDGTTEILKEYAEKYPDLIHLILHDENQYSKGIRRILATFVYPLVKGKYIAICEGDDYWTDPYKLQKQFDYLETHPDCVMCYSKANQFNQAIGRFVGEYGKDSSFDKQLFHDDIPTLTMFYRKSVYVQYQNENFPQSEWKMDDMPLCMYFYKYGQVKFLPEIMGVYRILENSASHFVDVEKAYKFMDNSLKVRLFMLDKYGSEKVTKKQVAQQQLIWYLKLALKYNQEIKSFNYNAFKKQFQVFSLKNDIKFFLVKKEWGRKLLGKKNQL